jgi:signal transduction histidine kinase
MMRVRWRKLWPQIATNWFEILAATSVVPVFIMVRLALQMFGIGKHQILDSISEPFEIFGFGTSSYRLLGTGELDVLAIGFIAVAMGVLTKFVHLHLHSEMVVLEQQRRESEAVALENLAVVRLCQTVVEEFSQPLTGALVYSELLTTQTAYASDDQRRELTGLREGVLQMERLVETLRNATTNAISREERVAAAVTHAVTQSRVRHHVHISAPRILTRSSRTD